MSSSENQLDTDLGDQGGQPQTESTETADIPQRVSGELFYGQFTKVLCKNILQSICRNYPGNDGYRFIHDIVAHSTKDRAQRLIERIKEASSNRTGHCWGVIYHPEKEQGHIHVFHRCLYYGSYCRCAGLRTVKVKRRRARFTPSFNDTKNLQFWINWFKYFLQAPRDLLYLEIAGMDYSNKIHRLKTLQRTQQPTGDETDGPMEGSFFACEGVDRDSSLGCESDLEDQQSIGSADSVANRRSQLSTKLRVISKGLKPRDTCLMLLENLKLLLCVPIEASCDTSEWLKQPELLFFNKSDPDYKKACSAYLRLTQYLTFDDLHSLHTNPNAKCLYYQRTPEPYYMSPSESLALVEQLLFHQYGSLEAVTNFVRRLYEICEKMLPKKNTMYCCGAPNSGKSWFFEMVATFYLNIGHVKNFTKYTTFPLNDCVNRRILLWNEPSIAPSQYETVKMLAGGDPCAAAVKYEGDAKVLRTPLLITANHTIFSQQEVWTSRIYTEIWKQAPMLKDKDLYPDPLSYYLLIKKYLN